MELHLVSIVHTYFLLFACNLSWKCQHFGCLQKVNFEDMSLCCPNVSAQHGQHGANIATVDVFFTSYVVLCC
jgi:hypothetical protein